MTPLEQILQRFREELYKNDRVKITQERAESLITEAFEAGEHNMIATSAGYRAGFAAAIEKVKEMKKWRATIDGEPYVRIADLNTLIEESTV